MKKTLIVLLLMLMAWAADTSAQTGSYQVRQARALIDQGRYLDAAKLLRPLADGGNAEAQYYAAKLFYEGKGVTKSEAQALKYGRMSASKGNTDAMVLLGKISAGKNDHATALKYYKQAAAAGNASAYGLIGECYVYEWGVEYDPETALINFLTGAQAGDSWSQYFTAYMYYGGFGCKRNLDEAMKWVEKAMAQRGYCLGYALKGCIYECQGDLAKARAQFENLVENGCATDDYNIYACLSRYYRNGWGGVSQNPMLALTYLQKSFDMKQAGKGRIGLIDYVEPELEIGDYYREGIGVQKNPQKAIEYYNMYGKSMNCPTLVYPKLADIYFDETSGMTDKKKAAQLCVDYFNGPRRNDDMDMCAARILGLCYYYGIGVEQDKRRGLTLMRQMSDWVGTGDYERLRQEGVADTVRMLARGAKIRRVTSITVGGDSYQFGYDDTGLRISSMTVREKYRTDDKMMWWYLSDRLWSTRVEREAPYSDKLETVGRIHEEHLAGNDGTLTWWNDKDFKSGYVCYMPRDCGDSIALRRGFTTEEESYIEGNAQKVTRRYIYNDSVRMHYADGNLIRIDGRVNGLEGYVDYTYGDIDNKMATIDIVQFALNGIVGGDKFFTCPREGGQVMSLGLRSAKLPVAATEPNLIHTIEYELDGMGYVTGMTIKTRHSELDTHPKIVIVKVTYGEILE